MSVHDLAHMTWEEVRDLEKARTVAILPVGAIEAHGPHLPLATDVIIAQAMARQGAERLAARGLEVLVLPAVQHTTAPFAASFAGTIGIRPATLSAVVTDIVASLGAHGVPLVALANAHFDPAHVAALHEAVAACHAAGGADVVFPDVTRKPWVTRLTDEFKSGACHAGRYEGSIVLATRHDLVRASVMSKLPPNPQSLAEAIRDGKRTFEAAGGARAYFGWPAEATAEEGRHSVEALGAILEEAVLAARPRRATP